MLLNRSRVRIRRNEEDVFGIDLIHQRTLLWGEITSGFKQPGHESTK